MVGPAGRTRLNKDTELGAAETDKHPDISPCLSKDSVLGEVPHAGICKPYFRDRARCHLACQVGRLATRRFPVLIVQLDSGWRVVKCSDGQQWFLQRRPKKVRRNDWRGRSFCRYGRGVAPLYARLRRPYRLHRRRPPAGTAPLGGEQCQEPGRSVAPGCCFGLTASLVRFAAAFCVFLNFNIVF